ncbi:MAG: protein-disulfide reductase DsbD [Sulfurospirillum sp.]
MTIQLLRKIARVLILLFFINITLYAAFPKQNILSPEDAFKVSSVQTDKGVDIKIKLGEKMYAYDNKLHVELVAPKKVLLDKESTRPKPVKFHEFIVHRKDINIIIPMSVIRKYVKNGKYKIKVLYQGCSERGLCYSPMSNTYEYSLLKKVQNTKKQKTAKIITNVSQEDTIAQSIKNSSFFIVLLTFFGFGLLLSLTPCVFPMIPILSSVIVSQSDKNMNAKKAFFLSLVYVLAMSLAYTIAGVLAGLFGANIQTALQDPWVLSVFSLVFVLLSLSMFGFYEIQMPSFIQSKLSKRSNNNKGGVIGVAIMGFLSALIVGPCVAAPLAGALIYIGQSGDALLGGAALFVMSLGMGIPLLIIGAGAGKFMPHPGVWMDNIKAIFGVLMLAVAIYMLSRILDSQITMLLWMALLLITSVYMGALEPLKENSSGWSKLFKGLGIIVFIYSLFLFVGAMRGTTNPLNPLEEKSAQILQIQNSNMTAEHAVFKIVKTLDELDKIVKNSKKPVMIDFYADWCISCKELDEKTFKDVQVRNKMDRFNLIRIDVTKNDLEDKKLLKRFNVFGPPAIIFFKNGKELKSLKVVGYKNAEEFAPQLDKVLAK